MQLIDRVEIYRLMVESDDGQLEYKLVEKINRAFECSLLVSFIRWQREAEEIGFLQ